MKLKLLFLLLVIAAFHIQASAQTVGIKTNLVSDATLSPSLGIEVGVAPKWTVDLSGQLNLWTVRDHKWKHAYLQPEARYWFCQRFSGNFVGAHLIGGLYNVGNIDLPISFLGTDFRSLRDHRKQGWMVGAGIAYGHAWILDRHWNLEAEIGIGWLYTRYDEYPCAECGRKTRENEPHNYFGPTKVAINFVYLF